MTTTFAFTSTFNIPLGPGLDLCDLGFGPSPPPPPPGYGHLILDTIVHSSAIFSRFPQSGQPSRSRNSTGKLGGGGTRRLGDVSWVGAGSRKGVWSKSAIWEVGGWLFEGRRDEEVECVKYGTMQRDGAGVGMRNVRFDGGGGVHPLSARIPRGGSPKILYFQPSVALILKEFFLHSCTYIF